MLLLSSHLIVSIQLPLSKTLFGISFDSIWFNLSVFVQFINCVPFSCIKLNFHFQSDAKRNSPKFPNAFIATQISLFNNKQTECFWQPAFNLKFNFKIGSSNLIVRFHCKVIAQQPKNETNIAKDYSETLIHSLTLLNSNVSTHSPIMHFELSTTLMNEWMDEWTNQRTNENDACKIAPNIMESKSMWHS